MLSLSLSLSLSVNRGTGTRKRKSKSKSTGPERRERMRSQASPVSGTVTRPSTRVASGEQRVHQCERATCLSLLHSSTACLCCCSLIVTQVTCYIVPCTVYSVYTGWGYFTPCSWSGQMKGEKHLTKHCLLALTKGHPVTSNQWPVASCHIHYPLTKRLVTGDCWLVSSNNWPGDWEAACLDWPVENERGKFASIEFNWTVDVIFRHRNEWMNCTAALLFVCSGKYTLAFLSLLAA